MAQERFKKSSMFIKGEQFKAGDELIWTRGNGTTERVRFKSYSEATVAVSPEGSAFPNQPTPLAKVVRTNGKEIMVPVAELSRPT
jgi:hypothetical protein